MKRFAILYDFDYTLSKGFMQDFGLVQDLGYKTVYEFFDDASHFPGAEDMDLCLSLLLCILSRSKQKGKKVTREYLQKYGKNVEFYPGVKEWFKNINAIGKKHGFDIEHFVISSGNKEIIEGTPIAKYFKRIYANFYAFGEDGEAYWPSQIVNYTTKLQYVYRVRKNILDDLASTVEINEKLSQDKVLPFEYIIYIGDSQTDIPSFKVIKQNGGASICVYDSTQKALDTAKKCFNDGRVNFIAPADYSKNSELSNIIINIIKNAGQKNID